MAEKPWWAAVARPMISTATQTLSAKAAKPTGTAQSAQISIAVLRALFRSKPIFIRREERKPPPTLPTSDSR